MKPKGNDPFKSPPPQSGFPAGTSGNRPNIQPTGGYEDASLGPNNGRALIKNMGTTGSVRVQNGSIRSLGGQENLAQSGNNGFVQVASTNVALPGPPVDNFFDTKGGTSFLFQEINPISYVALPNSAFPYLTVTFYLNQSEQVSDEISITAINSYSIIRGVNYPTPPATSPDSVPLSPNPRYSFITNVLLRQNFDRINLRVYESASFTTYAVRALFTTGDASLLPLSSSWSSP
jgi:hypothetical protein